MFLQIASVLGSSLVEQARVALEVAEWTGGKLSDRSTCESLRGVLLTAVEEAPKFISAALPTKILPPQFYRDAPGEPSAPEMNKAIRTIPGSSSRVRSDLAATIFLSDPATYEGGDLVVKNGQNEQRIKLPAGHLILYSSGSRHEIRPVTSGISFRCTLWVQSMIRDNGQRKILFDMDTAVQELSKKIPDDPSVINLTRVYHNLLRYWAQP